MPHRGAPDHDGVIPEGAGRCQAGLACGFAMAAGFAGQGGMASRLVSPGWCPFVRAGRRVRDRAEPGRRGGAAGVLDAQAGEPDHGRPGGKPQARGRGYAVVVAPSCRCAAWQARWLPSSLRDARPCWPGPHGAVRVSPGAGQSHSRPRRRSGGHTFARPRARPGRQLTPPDGKRGGRARRAGRRTPGSAAPGPPRSWRCSGLPSRGGPGSPP
jgi:hypothetical protein